MTLRPYTTDEKLTVIEALIRTADGERASVLASIAQDLRARKNGAPSVALCEIERRLTAVHRSKTALGYSVGSLRGLGEEVVGRWPVVKQALERFGGEIE